MKFGKVTTTDACDDCCVLDSFSLHETVLDAQSGIPHDNVRNG